ncbi:acetaldehyde dehydrogenase [Streptomyces sp. LBUM 1478]|uniref:Acetaldehyde dehydrogenase n=8 Tax=Streptomyces TaxID=1883 RepID=A0AAP6BJJ8_9ACTN|nr:MULTISPECIES: acetaldehyde dehydrogenase [Streptomyces]MBP5865039.1 acetaldehyde dehydrogenase [Streptomyces sp. LBUM 1484]MBP5872914.1 acetaldehyde dehydrogenase [Streptomyces sp. LBUM 1485]MBP5904728.1 acetaldehyde dehydrogenase [Streptomyces sp. LBUM 1478]MBP5933094.1 acetaldehyde dehydrogenase [Streptomyces sp. LBUM 1479]MBP5940951.1 acetaldehyde dehydrogenase [Streptomyces sp. LBUM 1476]
MRSETTTTAGAIEKVGGAQRGKAIIVLNPAEPPLIMRDTVFVLVDAPDPAAWSDIRQSIEKMVADVAAYVPGYRLKQQTQITEIPGDQPLDTLLEAGTRRPTHQVSVFLEVEGAAHYLPAYAGNLDIMTAAGLQVAERIAAAKADSR